VFNLTISLVLKAAPSIILQSPLTSSPALRSVFGRGQFALLMRAPPAMCVQGKLTAHPVNARTWTPECMNLITGRGSKQLRAPVFCRKLTRLHLHARSLLTMQE